MRASAAEGLEPGIANHRAGAGSRGIRSFRVTIMRLTLEVRSGLGRPRKVLVESAQTVRVGRAEEADLSLPEDTMLSRLHFAIECGAETCRLRDLGSTNGTLLNGQQVGTSGPLQQGDEIRAGQTTFRVHLEAAATAPNPSPTDQDRGTIKNVGDDPLRDDSSVAASGGARDPGHSRPWTAARSKSRARPGRHPGAAESAAKDTPTQTLAPDQFATATMLWEDLEGTPRMTVIIKVTCEMPFDGPAPIGDPQLPIFTADVPGGDDPGVPARFESDMVPLKPKSDVVLVGKAHSPRNKRPEAPLDVILRVGRLEKKIRVFGDRTWRFPTRLALIPDFTSSEPFTTMDLIYERAFGGIDEAAARYCAENLVGRGFIGKWSPDSIDGKPLPNLEDPSNLIRTWDSRPKPVGFGFYGRGWMPRLKLAGTPHNPPDPQEQKRGLPSDFSYGFFNGAHPDLQVEGYLTGDEEVELTNLSPAPYLEFRLPGIRPRVTVAKWTTPPTEWIDRQGQEGRVVSIDDVPTTEERIRTVLDTLVPIPEERIFYGVFRGNCKLTSLETLEVARIGITMESGTRDAGKARLDRTGKPR